MLPLIARCGSAAVRGCAPKTPAILAARALSVEAGGDVHARLEDFYDVVIVGSGMVGGAAACALGGNATLSEHRILLLEGGPRRPYAPVRGKYSNRVSAVSLANATFLRDCGAWGEIEAAGRCHPFENMRVWDGVSDAAVAFDAAADTPGDPMGYLVENDAIQAATMARAGSLPNVTVAYDAPVSAVSLPRPAHGGHQFEDEWAEVTVGGRRVQTRLLIAADGPNSFVRRSTDIESLAWDYDQAAVVATLAVSLPANARNGTAWQRFLPTGPIALLPLSDTVCSLVWSTSRTAAKSLLALSDAAFADEVQRAFSSPADTVLGVRPGVLSGALGVLGEVAGNLAQVAGSTLFQSVARSALSAVGIAQRPSQAQYEDELHPRQQIPPIVSCEAKSRASFPLSFSHATHYVRHRLALIGDAAHRVHPLAGQGVNLGFGDAREIAANVAESVAEGQDIGALHRLFRYETARQRANLPIMAATDALKRLFSTDFPPTVLARSFGFSLTNAADPVKRKIVRHAMFGE